MQGLLDKKKPAQHNKVFAWVQGKTERFTASQNTALKMKLNATKS